MQYWIIYQAGVGGDGFANLLEHCAEVRPADDCLEWRRHYEINGKTKFYSCAWANDPKPFRYKDLGFSDPNPVYLKLVQQNEHTVIPVHYFYWTLIDQYPYKNIVTRNQILIHLYSSIPQRAFVDAHQKNKLPIPDEIQRERYIDSIKKELERSDYHYHVDIERVWRDWHYLETLLSTWQITLKESIYRKYLEMVHA